jgi:hypothetical protein
MTTTAIAYVAGFIALVILWMVIRVTNKTNSWFLR